jgi:HlyD family secretion protein
MKKLIVLAILLAVVGGSGYWYWQEQGTPQSSFQFAKAKRGRLVATVGATGTTQPREVVDVGAQVLGRIIYIGKDPNTQSKIVDWGSLVKGPIVDEEGNVKQKGTVLAQIDPDLYTAQVRAAQASMQAAIASVAAAEASVQTAQAAVQSARADLVQKQATLKQATADWGRAQKLFGTAGIQQAEYDQIKAVFETQTAAVAVSQANIRQTESNVNTALAQVNTNKANVETAKANLKTAQTNLDYTTITAPVDGIVIDRRVNVGQTVVASLSAPSLFLIAKDLTRMEVWSTVNEVDLGKIRVGQDVNFTVDAFPGRVWHGKVVPQGRLAARLNATMTQNVVTYTVVVSADNADGRLYPYLTTNLSFIVADKKDVLLVPNAALRYQPSRAQIAPEDQEAYFKTKGKKRSPTDTEGQDEGFVWVKGVDGLVHFIQIRTGLSDSVNTEVVNVVAGGDLADNMEVIVGEGRADKGGSGASPFAPKMFQGKKKEG